MKLSNEQKAQAWELAADVIDSTPLNVLDDRERALWPHVTQIALTLRNKAATIHKNATLGPRRNKKPSACRWGLEVHMEARDFGWALTQLRNKAKVRRCNWNGKGMWLELQVPDEHSKMTLPYIFIEYPEGHPAYPKGSRCPWLASQTDLLTCDWELVA